MTRTSFIKPVFVGVPVRVCARVPNVDVRADGTRRIELDVWAEDGEGMQLTVGGAATNSAPGRSE